MTPPVTVVVAEYDGTLEVTPPAVAPGGDGAVTLTAQAAESSTTTTGAGHDEKPSVYKLQWNFTAAPGRYRVTVEPAVADASVEIDGTPAADVATLAKRGFHTLAITPRKPFVEGHAPECDARQSYRGTGEIAMPITRRQFAGALSAAPLVLKVRRQSARIFCGLPARTWGRTCTRAATRTR